MLPSRSREDDGVALLSVLFVVAFLTMLAVLFMANAVSQSSASRFARDYETVVHTAEMGVDEVIVVVNKFPEHVSTVGSSDDVVGISSTSLSDDQLVQWVLAAADDHVANGGALSQTNRGEAFAARPCLTVNPSDPEVCDEPSNLIVSVGWIPNRAQATERRVVKVLFDNDLFVPSFALQVDCDPSQSALKLSGNAGIGGVRGDVHVNCDVQSIGNTWSISGTMSMAGTWSGQTPSSSQYGTLEQNSDDQPSPEIEVREQYSRAHDYLNGDPQSVQWWDLCPDGTVRWPHNIVPGIDASGNYNPDLDTVAKDGAGNDLLPVQPCGNPEIRWQDGDVNHFLGWKWVNNGWSAQDVRSGVFYVYRSNAKATGGQGKVSAFVEKTPDNNGGANGNLSISGNVKLSPAIGQVLFMTDRDLELSGTLGAFLSGFSAAHEQIDARGNVQYVGSLYAQNAEHTTGSPVSQSAMDGSFSLTYDDELDIFLSGIVRVVAWNELAAGTP